MQGNNSRSGDVGRKAPHCRLCRQRPVLDCDGERELKVKTVGTTRCLATEGLILGQLRLKEIRQESQGDLSVALAPGKKAWAWDARKYLCR